MTRLQAMLTSATLLAVVTLSGGSDAAPKKPKPPKPPVVQPDEGVEFDKTAAASALSSVDLVKCKTTNAPRGEGHVTVKFSPAGTATEATVDRGTMAGTPTAKCIAKEFKKTTIPAFRGDGVSVGKLFKFE